MDVYHIWRREVGLPNLQTRQAMNPTLLVSWFCTVLSLICILVRLMGRWVRTEKLLREDKVMFWSIVPLVGRMGLVHVILIWGTNNTVTTELSELEIHRRMIGSKLVLPARILYAGYIWTAKITILEFLQRLIGHSWIKSYETGMRTIYAFLGLTFAGVVVATLAECQPFTHYWQVVPDPGSQCRAGIAQLITMGTCDMVTDLVLMGFPIPLVVMSSMRMKRKISLILLFLLSLGPLAITAYRIPSTIQRGAPQQFRSLLASVEILAATGVANAIVIGSFVRDRGVKKAKFRALSVDGSTMSRQQTRAKSIAVNHWGSDEDLVRDYGISVQPQLRHSSISGNISKPAPIAMSALTPHAEDAREHEAALDTNWDFNRGGRRRRRSSASESVSSASTDLKLRDLEALSEEPPSPGATRDDQRMSFFDVGGLIDQPSAASHNSADLSRTASSQPGTNLFISDVGGLLSTPRTTSAQDDAIREVPPGPAETGAGHGMPHKEDLKHFLRSASPFRRDKLSLGARQSPRNSRLFSSSPRAQPLAADTAPDDLDISDAGGLLK